MSSNRSPRILAAASTLFVVAVLALAEGRSASDIAGADGAGPGMSLSVADLPPDGHCDDAAKPTECTIGLNSAFTLAVLTNAAPNVPVSGLQTEVELEDLNWNQNTCQNEVQVTRDGGLPVSCVSGLGPNNKARHAVLAGTTPPSSPTLDLTPGGSHENLLELSLSCGYSSSYSTVTLNAGGPFGAMYFDTSWAPIPVKNDPADTLLIRCYDPPPPTPEPEVKQETYLTVIGPDTVLQGETVSLFGVTNFGQDLNGDTVAGWFDAQVTIEWPTLGGVAESFWLDDVESDAICETNDAEAQSAGECRVQSYDYFPWWGRAHGPVEYFLSLDCATTGTHEITVTTEFAREYWSPVPPEKMINNTDSVEVTCLPHTPIMQKVDSDVDGDVAGDSLDNLFLTKQGAKLPPVTCAASSDTAVLAETLSIPVGSLDPKGTEAVQDLAAFEFEVKFDNKLVCVNLVPGPAAANMTCMIRDKDSSQLEGLAQIACFTTKGSAFPDTSTPQGQHQATIEVRPQPELYSQLIANQENGITVQLLNQNCELADANGHPIPIYSCEDADITVRYLEGDVDADCTVDAAIDGQLLAFRWGAEKGNLLYNERYDLEPSASVGGGGVNGDGDIDVKDIQTVFGRHGSTCAAPNPPQPPINPKS